MTKKNPFQPIVDLAERDFLEFQTFIGRADLTSDEGDRLDTLIERFNLFVDQVRATPELAQASKSFVEKYKGWVATLRSPS